ncbi:MAG: sigma-70 family RNA polymerase sigma factor [Oscillospiraceae bacterium]|nr:sigma-70 family RNA polymerase sigma factor [Oscillospiraceae bacterium]
MRDEEIIGLFQRRDQRALAETERSYGSLCRGLAKRILKSPEDAEECLNDSYLRLWQRIPPEEPASLGSYLTRILRNLCVDRLRQEGAAKRGGSAVTVSLEELEQVTGRGDVESQLSARELGQAVGQFLRTQSDEARNIFLRRYYYLDSRTDIAQRYGISAAQVSVSLSRTRKRLRAYLKKEELL